MRGSTGWFRGVVVGGLVLGLAACGSRSLGESPVVPEEAVAHEITLDVHEVGSERLVESRIIAGEGAVVIAPDADQPFTETPQYYVFARAAGFYTELYEASFGDTVEVDLDGVPDLPDGMAGVVFHGDRLGTPCYFAHERVAFGRPDEEGSLQYVHDIPFLFQETDRQGRYGVAGFGLGQWLMVFTAVDMEQVFPLLNSAATDYADVLFYDEMFARAPNLYLYPEVETDVRVTLGFPQGGAVVESTPEYGDGWEVRITPDGVVDGQHPYLFYEASLPRRVQTREGWVVPGDDLAGNLGDLLAGLGFAGREIADFLEYWVPLLEGGAAYALYPQEAGSLVTLDIQPAPARLRRIWLLVRALDGMIDLRAPAPLAPFAREGYFGVEWGVILMR